MKSFFVYTAFQAPIKNSTDKTDEAQKCEKLLYNGSVPKFEKAFYPSTGFVWRVLLLVVTLFSSVKVKVNP